MCDLCRKERREVGEEKLNIVISWRMICCVGVKAQLLKQTGEESLYEPKDVETSRRLC